MRLLYKAPTDYTKPQQTIQSPNRQYKNPTDNTKTRHIRQNPDILDNPPKDNTKPRSPAISNAGLVWGPGIRIINIGYIELGLRFCICFAYFCLFFADSMSERVRSRTAHWAHEELRCTSCRCTAQLLAATSPTHER